MCRKTLKVAFTDDIYGTGINGPIIRTLEHNYIISESETPDLVFYCEGKQRTYKRFTSAIRFHVAIENRYPDFSDCDYALTFLFLDDPRHLRVPM